jgi:histidinol dehydrogenase
VIEPSGGGLRRVLLDDLDADERRRIVDRSATVPPGIRDQVRSIVDAVRAGGDRALRDANARYGGGLAPRDGAPPPLTIGRDELLAARDALPGDLRAALEQMIDHITRFHAMQVPAGEQWVAVAPGIDVGRVWRPIDRVAAYVPGGTAAYPSSLLMSAIPARLAGVRDFVVASPAGPHGVVSPALLGAAGLLGIEAFFVMGGAQAIAALAYGTESVPPVDKIVGPGNAWVTAAKLEVLGVCAIDMPAGPSEVMVVADDAADPVHVAADLLSQAEHGADSPAVLVTPSARLADRVQAEIDRQLPALPRQAALRGALAAAGTIVITADIGAALAFANEYAPEHLSVVVRDEDRALEAIRHAGSLFLGAYAPESAGDYATGSNHVLPTGRLARAYGALGVESFGRWLQVQRVTQDGLARVRETVAAIADAEGLTAHRRAVEVRFEGGAAE